MLIDPQILIGSIYSLIPFSHLKNKEKGKGKERERSRELMKVFLRCFYANIASQVALADAPQPIQEDGVRTHLETCRVRIF